MSICGKISAINMGNIACAPFPVPSWNSYYLIFITEKYSLTSKYSEFPMERTEDGTQAIPEVFQIL